MPDPGPTTTGRSALVLTVSDRSAAGTREDASGQALEGRLAELGFEVERRVVPDEQWEIEQAIVSGAAGHRLVVTTGGTGLTPRDVTPQATAVVLDYEVPGIAEAMRAEGRRSTPFASLSRGLVGVRGGSLIVNVPGSPRGALESFEVVVPLLDHALETLAGPFDHAAARAGGRADLPAGEPASG
jgi:molybdopterin adenylyltransferase